MLFRSDLKSKGNQMTARRANGCSNDNYSKEFDMKMPSWRCTCWRAGVSRVRLGGRPAGVDVGLPDGVSSPCVNNGHHQHPAGWLQDKESSSVRGEKLTFLGAGSGIGASSRGRLPAGSLEVALIKGCNAKEVIREGTAKKGETSKKGELTRALCGGAGKTTALRARRIPGWWWARRKIPGQKRLPGRE